MAQIKLNATYGLTGNLPAVNGSAVTNLTSGNLSGNLPALNGAALTALNASNVASGTLNTSRYVQGGISMANSWRLSSALSGSSSPITANWEEIDTDGYGDIGTSMSNSSGVFSFPSTGIYMIHIFCNVGHNAESTYNIFALNTTTDNSNYGGAAQARVYISGGDGDETQSGYSNFIFDVTNTSTHKIRFDFSTQNSATLRSDTNNQIGTGFTIIRLGDT